MAALWRTLRGLARHPLAALLAVAAAVAWVYRAVLRRRLAAANARAREAEIAAAVAVGRERVAEMRSQVAADHAAEITAAERAAERIEHVPVTDDPERDRAALYDALRVLPPKDSRGP